MRTLSGLLLAALTAALAGCAAGGRTEDFTPPADNARKAVDAALAHWQGGGSPGTIPNTGPAVEVQDGRWKAGQKLKGYEIVREDPADGAARVFAVKLTTDKGPQEARYMVFGIDPVWVTRDEDYKKLSGAGK